MKQMVRVLFLAVLCMCIFVCSASATSFSIVLSNEDDGYLIDKLIAQGHGDDSLQQVLQYLQPYSGGAISTDFMNEIAATPAGSDVKTVDLFNFAGLNNPVGVNDDGTLIIASIYGNDYFEQTGYTTNGQIISGLGTVLFTSANDSDHYIIGVGGTGGYVATAIIWAVPDQQPAPVPEPATLLLFGTGIAGLIATRRKKAA